jgi:hypothetical protein
MANNVTIKNSKVTCTDPFAIYNKPGTTGTLISDTTITCNDGAGTGIAGAGYTVLRTDISHCVNGFSIDADAVVQDSYVHDLFETPGAHVDGIQMGGTNVKIVHNTIFNPVDETSAIITDPTNVVNMVVQDNLLGGGGYTVYCPKTTSTNFQIVNNHFSRKFYPKGGFYGTWVYCDQAAAATGNVWDDTGQAVAF